MDSRRAVSPILSVVILMGVAIVGGVFLGATQNSFMQVALSETEMTITDLRIEKDSQSGCYLFTSIYNSGSESIRGASFRSTIDGNADWSFEITEIGSGLEPGNSTSVIKTPDEQMWNNVCGNLTVSNTYSVSINGSSGESAFNAIKQVTVNEVARR